MWVFNYSPLLEASKIFFTHFLICLFSKLKSHGLHHINALPYLPLFPLSFSEVFLVPLDPFQHVKCEQASAQNSSYRHTISMWHSNVLCYLLVPFITISCIQFNFLQLLSWHSNGIVCPLDFHGTIYCKSPKIFTWSRTKSKKQTSIFLKTKRKQKNTQTLPPTTYPPPQIKPQTQQTNKQTTKSNQKNLPHHPNKQRKIAPPLKQNRCNLSLRLIIRLFCVISFDPFLWISFDTTRRKTDAKNTVHSLPGPLRIQNLLLSFFVGQTARTLPSDTFIFPIEQSIRLLAVICNPALN